MTLPGSPTGPSVTDWMQGVGALLAVPIAVWSTIVANRAKKTSEKSTRIADQAQKASDQADRSVAQARTATDWAVGQGNEFVNERLRAEGKTVWEIRRSSGSKRQFINRGTTDVRLVSVQEVETEGRASDVMLLPGYEGVHISPGNGFEVIYETSLASPAVAKVEVTWEEGPRKVTQVYAVS